MSERERLAEEHAKGYGYGRPVALQAFMEGWDARDAELAAAQARIEKLEADCATLTMKSTEVLALLDQAEAALANFSSGFRYTSDDEFGESVMHNIISAHTVEAGRVLQVIRAARNGDERGGSDGK